ADNPGYRIECRAYPELNDKKFQSRDGGMFYTYDQIRDVISLAHELGIRVIPEIDIPGHSAYFDRTFGFSMDSPEGRKVLESCFAEFFAEIPASDCPIVHIGSDEVQIADPTGFMRWAQDMVRRAGRTPMSWDPGLPSDSTTILQIWNTDRVEQRLLQERPFVDSYVGYLNYYDPIYFVNKLFHHTPEPKSQGAILCLWNDVKVDDKFNIERHNGMVPGMMAFAERFWRGAKEDSDFTEFESRMAFHRDHYCIHSPCYYVACGAMQWQIQVADTLLHTTGGAVDMDVLCANNNIKVDAPMALTATTTIYSKADTTIRAWVSFETPARSNRISLGIPEQGQWPQGFEVRVNGVAVEPPLWKEPGRYGINFNTWHSKENELPYTDEQFYWTRTPSYITLNKGENKVVVNAPKSFAGQRWSFAFIPLVINKNGVAVEFK
ncbi:MAG: family 20 glycosylhydrolase, partial [Mucinivorans sp.]